MPPIRDVKALRQELAAWDAERLAAEERRHAVEREEHEHWVEALRHPHLAPDAEERLAARIDRAVRAGRVELELLRFPKELTTDSARAINQAEAGWETTLSGLPKLAYDYWATHLRGKGYRLRAEVMTYPGGMPGDCALILSWAG